MKTKTRTTARPRRPQPNPRRRPATDPFQRAVVARRLYTDFLALAFYPGMRSDTPRTDPHAA